MARILVGFPRVSQECASYTSHHVILKEMDGLNMKQIHISEVLVCFKRAEWQDCLFHESNPPCLRGLKGECHQIFDLNFFHEINTSKPPINRLKYFEF